jgi:hypothetical protein
VKDGGDRLRIGGKGKVGKGKVVNLNGLEVVCKTIAKSTLGSIPSTIRRKRGVTERGLETEVAA